MRNRFYSRLNAGCSEQSEIDYHAMNASRIEAEDIEENTPKWVVAGLVLSILSAVCGIAAWIFA